MNKEINMKKDPAVELARIFGCLLVVGVHCWINNFGVDYIRIFYVQELQL